MLKREGVLALPLMLAASPAFGAQPIITSFYPTLGYQGDQVTITGDHFLDGPVAVSFWYGRPAAIYVMGNNQILATVPSGITTGPISINGVFTTGDFVATGPGPYISSVSPAYGAVGDTVIISGVHFLNTTAVLFGGTNAPSFMPNGDGTSINVTVPAGARNGPITVVAPPYSTNSPASFTVIGPGPFISGFSPSIGGGGSTVFINGRFFTGLTAVRFNGVAGGVVSASDTSIQAIAPATVTTGPISVSTGLGTNTTTTNYFVPPAIASLSPGNGRAGTNVTITGTSFWGTTNVSFNGVPAAGFTVTDNTHIQATVPAGVYSGQIRVIAPAASAYSSVFRMLPTVTGFNPANGVPGTPVTVTGANLNEGTPTVQFNGAAAASVSGVSFGQLTAVVPGIATTGPISVSNTNGSHTSAARFYLPPGIASITPANAPPLSRVTITGTNLLDTSAITFNGIAAPAFTVTNNTMVGVTVPATAITGPVALTAPGGVAVSPGVYYGPPQFFGFSPTHGLPGASITITGTNFLGASNVQFNGLAGGLVSANNGQIVATVPSGALTGPISVTAPAGTVTSTNNFVVDYTSDLATWLSASPEPVWVGSNLLYTISVVNNGPYRALNVTLTNTLGDGALVNSIAASQGTYDTNGNPVRVSLGALDVHGSATILLGVTPTVSGTLIDTISVGSDYLDPYPTNNTAFATSTVLPLPIVSIRRSANNPLVRVFWPAALTNWHLLAQTNAIGAGIGSGWLDVPGSFNTNQVFLPIESGKGSVFYRLIGQ